MIPLNLILPSLLPTASFSQITQCNFLSPSLELYQNLDIILSISLHTPSGNLKQLIMYEGIDWATTLVSTFFLALDKTPSFHPFSFFHTWWITKEKTSFLDLQKITRRPKYLKWVWTIFTPILLWVIYMTSSGMFWLKKASYFLRLTIWLEEAWY